MSVSWLHIARIVAPDGSAAWLILPSADDAIFAWALERAAPSVRRLPTIRGWILSARDEAALWSVVTQVHGVDSVCRTCLHSEIPCDLWIALVSKRFDYARRAQEEAVALQARNVREQYENPFPSPRASSWRSSFRTPPPRRPPPPPAVPKPSRDDRLRAAATVLGIAWPADRDAVKKAFRKAALRFHPDLGGSDQAMIAVVNARDELMRAV